MTAAIGSTAWTAVARIVWVLGVDPQDETGSLRVARVSKSNFKMPENGVAFSIGDDERWECGYITGLVASSVTAEDLMAASTPPDERTERDEARELVKSVLEGGPMETSEFLKMTRSAGFSDRTVERARRDLGVKAKPQNDANTGKMTGWIVSLPPRQASPPSSLSGAVGGVGGVYMTSSFSTSFSNQSAQSATPPRQGPYPDDALFEDGEDY